MTIFLFGDGMKEEYDFTNAKKNPYVSSSIQQVKNNVDDDSATCAESNKKNDDNSAHSEAPLGAEESH